MINWNEINSLEQWNEVFDRSNEKPLFVFKHSTTCPISADALQQFQQYLESEPNKEIDYVLVKVIEARPVSNQIAADIRVKHESPQAIIIDKKQAKWNASHWKITNKSIKEAIEAIF